MDNNKIIELFFEVTKKMNQIILYRDGHIDPLIGQYRCLFLLNKVNKISQKELASILGIRSTSLSELVNKLENKGYVYRYPSSEDRRLMMVAITDEGKKETLNKYNASSKRNDYIMNALSEEEKEQFTIYLEKIKNQLMIIQENKNE